MNLLKLNRWKGLERDFLLFILISACIGFASSTIDSIMNNFFATYNMTPVMRGWLEFPRELPGLLLVVVSGVLVFMGNVRMAVLATIISSIGLMGLGFVSPTYGTMVLWLFLFNAGTHLWMPLNSSIGVALSKEGQTGRRLGQFSGVTTAAGILGSLLIWAGFSYWHFNFQIAFVIGTAAFLTAGFLLWRMHPGVRSKQKFQWVFRRQYFLYYGLSILYGARKQVFITFAPWVLIKIYNQPTQIFAVLGIIGSIVGVLIIPVLGRGIDRFGERKVLMAEALMLIVVCAGYGFAKQWGLEKWALYITFACFIGDRMLMSVGMARVTYLKKIAVHQEDITPTLSMGISIDHIVSMLIPALGGLVWETMGYQYVFVGAALIAVMNFFMASRISIPDAPSLGSSVSS